MSNWKNNWYFKCHTVSDSKCQFCWYGLPPTKCNKKGCLGLVHSDHECTYDAKGNQICKTYFECDLCHKLKEISNSHKNNPK